MMSVSHSRMVIELPIMTVSFPWRGCDKFPDQLIDNFIFFPLNNMTAFNNVDISIGEI